MTKWELKSMVCSISSEGFIGGRDVSVIWSQKDRNTGKTNWDELKEIANDGWELVSVTPIASNQGTTIDLLYTFKRPKEN
jgi:DNA invertase Pin-like site-specific DNA recombinase